MYKKRSRKDERPNGRPVHGRGYAEIAAEWDRIAELRFLQETSGRDLTFEHILVPTILKFLEDCDLASVLDAGCGTGVLTFKIAEIAERVVGIDLSSRSVEIARQQYGDTPNLTFVTTTLERFQEKVQSSFSTVVANMVLMTTPLLEDFVKAGADSLQKGGHFIFTVTHPWFWPKYWGYEQESWFSYNQEVAVEAPFAISLEERGPTTTHYHRPLNEYFEAFRKAGLAVTALQEPVPDPSTETLYPHQWTYPRYLAGTAIKALESSS